VTAAPRAIAAVCFDLDDTLYPQSSWLDGAWAAVARRAALDGLDGPSFRRALDDVAAEGSDQGWIIDRALARIGAADHPVDPLVAEFRAYETGALEPFPGVRDALVRLATRVPLGLVSDGDPAIQRSKLAALALGDVFRVVVWSDEHGREHRKPDPLPFAIAVELFGVDAAEVVHIGDRPEKDVVGAAAAGLAAIRVRTGEWAHQPDGGRCWASVATVTDAIALVIDVLDQPSSTATSTRNSSRPGASR
jgi:putative hydrolase of the HAD superfamily